MTIIRAAALASMPWKNGGGITREIAAGPPGASLDAFAWRLSIADVSADGAFSTFAGVDRALVLLDGAGMRLTDAGGRTQVLDEPLALARFPGEAPVSASLIRGPTRDFNAMVRRDRARMSVSVRRDERWEIAADCDVTFVFCARGAVSVALAGDTRITLEAGDTWRIDRSDARACVCQAEVDAAWLHIRIDETIDRR
ncbi:HutD family protein [Caballeronia sp. Lep1P3]|uniref:HutD/Ves family protein n=1 Tax=Caballeronia sp. Lep1P3 TaxID=2878150 RepID=UPI001FD283DE|nr:HutD family protein [Caballeronia sp. Lep1P3]